MRGGGAGDGVREGPGIGGRLRKLYHDCMMKKQIPPKKHFYFAKTFPNESKLQCVKQRTL